MDLDNLFAFLSDSQNGSKKRLIDQIGEKMNELVNDLDYEVRGFSSSFLSLAFLPAKSSTLTMKDNIL